MRMHLLIQTLTLIAIVPLSSFAAEPLRLSSLFTDNAVLQRGQEVPVWGQAEPGQTVSVQFAGQQKSAAADGNGRWLVRLDALQANDQGRVLTARVEGSDPVAIQNVLVGEVWICSGQSNMAFGLAGSVNGKDAIASAGDPQLRLFAAAAKATDGPQESIGGSWKVDSPEDAQRFSAVAYYFGRELRTKLGVPVGLIRSAVGGTVAEAWTAAQNWNAILSSNRCWTSSSSAWTVMRRISRRTGNVNRNCSGNTRFRPRRQNRLEIDHHVSPGRQGTRPPVRIGRRACTMVRSRRYSHSRYVARSGIRVSRIRRAASSIEHCFRP